MNNKPRTPRRKILCKVYDADNNCDYMIIYTNGTWRWQSHQFKDAWSYWKLAHSDFGPMFLYTDDEANTCWRTDWQSEDAFEIKLANTIAQALADIEVEKMLKGEDGKT